MTLKDIYDYIERKFPYFKHAKPGALLGILLILLNFHFRYLFRFNFREFFMPTGNEYPIKIFIISVIFMKSSDQGWTYFFTNNSIFDWPSTFGQKFLHPPFSADSKFWAVSGRFRVRVSSKYGLGFLRKVKKEGQKWAVRNFWGYINFIFRVEKFGTTQSITSSNFCTWTA